MLSTAENIGVDAREMLLKYQQWINWWSADSDPEGYTKIVLEDWFKYEGETYLIESKEYDGYFKPKLVVLHAGYGDEGGPALLIASFDSNQLGYHMRWLMHEFDLTPQLIYQNSIWMNVPDSRNPEDG